MPRVDENQETITTRSGRQIKVVGTKRNAKKSASVLPPQHRPTVPANPGARRPFWPTS